MGRGGETFFAMECIATDPRGGGPLDVGETYGGAVALYVGECAAPARGGPLRGCTATICGGWLPVRRRSSAVDLRGGGPLYAGGGLTPRKGGVVLASATSFSPFFHLVSSGSSQL